MAKKVKSIFGRPLHKLQIHTIQRQYG